MKKDNRRYDLSYKDIFPNTKTESTLDEMLLNLLQS